MEQTQQTLREQLMGAIEDLGDGVEGVTTWQVQQLAERALAEATKPYDDGMATVPAQYLEG